MVQVKKYTDEELSDLLNWLVSINGQSTNMITLIIPSGSNSEGYRKMLVNELKTASNIKSHKNRTNVEATLRSMIEILRTHTWIPDNGLVIFSSSFNNISIYFEPPKPINKKLYMCDRIFHIDYLRETIRNDLVVGYIVVNGNGLLLAIRNNDKIEILTQYSVKLPNNHNKGGSSSGRFLRTRQQKVQAYLSKINESIIEYFTINGNPIVSCIIIGGFSEIKKKLLSVVDDNVRDIILESYDIKNDGELGLNELVELSKEEIEDYKFKKEKDVLNSFYDEIRNNGNYVYSLEHTLRALEMGLVKHIIINDKTKYFIDINNINNHSEIKKEGYVNIIKWLKHNDIEFTLISDNIKEGRQYINNYGGIGGILWYHFDFVELEMYDEVM